MKIGLAADHRGYELKKNITEYLEKNGYSVVDYGTNTLDSVDYPDFGTILGEKLVEKEFDIGVSICGTGIGISIACNKVKGVRCAKIDNIKEAKLARQHNNANIMAIGSDKPLGLVKDMLDIFLKTEFSNDERHQKRIDKLHNYENILK